MKLRLLIFFFILIQYKVFSQGEKSSEPIRFEIKNAGITVEGTISDWECVITFDPKRPQESSIKGVAFPVSIDTGIKLRDKHLQGRQYFNVEKFPEIRLSSKKITAKGKGSFVGIFELQIKEMKKEIEITFDVTTSGKNQNFSAEFTINRLDFGIGENSIILGDEVKVLINFGN